MIEQVIFSQLLHNEAYGRKVLPFLKPEYFKNKLDRVLFKLIDKYAAAFNSFPNKQALKIEAQEDTIDAVTDDEFKELLERIEAITFDETTQTEWAVLQTEKFCKDKALYNAISDSIEILDDKDGKKTPDSIPELLTNALSISFDTTIGHDLLGDWDKRYEFYHVKESRIPFDIDYLNTITNGGLLPKTLNIFLAGTGVGKSLAMGHMAAHQLTLGLNVLYITLEMAEERIAERVDANLLDMDISQVGMLPKDVFERKIEKIRAKTLGKLVIKEYPTGTAGAANFRHLINELRLKKKFVPQVIYIDYLNICCSSRLRQGANVSSYTYIKAIAEELRGLAVEMNVPMITASQLNRSGFSNSDPGMEDTSESFGLPMTADLMLAMVTNDELQSLGQILFKQLKNRYSDTIKNKRFVVGIDYAKMRLFNLEAAAQRALVDTSPAQSNGPKKKNQNQQDRFEDFS